MTKSVPIQTSDEAKTYTCLATSGRHNHEKAVRSLEYYRGMFSRATDEESKTVWRQQIEELETWISSEEYKFGDYPQGINHVILELIEWRAMLYAFQHVETESDPFREHVFYQQWLIGAAYAMFSLLAKLIGADKRENSLRKLWLNVEKFVARDGACLKEERKFISAQLDKTSGQFTNDRSKAILFRNTVIAHNEKSVQVEWGAIDEDIKVLVRIWSILVSWSSFPGGIPLFRTSEQAFSGLEGLFQVGELSSLAICRQEYIDMVKLWARTYLHNGQPDSGGTAFAQISVTSKVYVEPKAEAVTACRV